MLNAVRTFDTEAAQMNVGNKTTNYTEMLMLLVVKMVFLQRRMLCKREMGLDGARVHLVRHARAPHPGLVKCVNK